MDQRDAEELPMEHELLRISDADREAFDFVSPFKSEYKFIFDFSLQPGSKIGISRPTKRSSRSTPSTPV